MPEPAKAAVVGLKPLPEVVAHADWSLHPGGRWVARATLARDGRYRAEAPEPVGVLEDFFRRQAAAGEGARIMLGFDFPFGLPRDYAARAGISSFPAFLREVREGHWPDFFQVAEDPAEISLSRPFYPLRNKAKGEVKLSDLLNGLGLADREALLRACDRPTSRRPAAAAMFWTMGPQQVGKAAIAGWRDLLLPALVGAEGFRLWPFDGTLAALLAEPGLVITETYPGEAYHHLGLSLSGGSKRRQETRRGCAATLLERAERLGIAPDPDYRSLILEGFGPRPSGEDPFDATVGLFGMINVLRGHRAPGDPEDPAVRAVEGWILGQLENGGAGGSD